MQQRVVISGLGLVGALGCEREAVLTALAGRNHGLSRTEEFGGEAWLGKVKGFQADRFVERKKARRMEASNIHSLAAATLALEDAGLAGPDCEADRAGCGLMMGTGFSGFHSFVKHYERLVEDGIGKLSPIHFPNTVSNASAGMVAIELGLKGPCSTVTGIGACGEYAIFYAWLLLQRGMAERILVLGAEGLSEPLVKGFQDMGLLARPEAGLSLPYATSRHGLHMGEGGAALLLETETAALRRGRKPLGRLAGFGFRQAPENPFGYGEDPAYIVQACRQALDAAGLSPRHIAWVSGAANGSRPLDAVEARALSETFDPERTKVCALKGYTGEFASAGVMRVALGLLCASACMIPAPARASSEAPDPEAGPMSPYLNRTTAEKSAQTFLHLGLAPGGSCAAILVEGGVR